jgi:LysR family hydrogen peroxide-inducible transcriptional activator
VNLRDLEYVVALAEHRNFGRAADACFVSQPTLSTQVHKLEAELGVTLFERGTRETFPTDVGLDVIARARAVLVEVASIREIARSSQNPSAATIRLGIFPTLAPYLLPHVIPSLHRELPDLELLIVEEKTEELLRRLRDGRLDVVIVATPIVDDGLHGEPLFTEDFVLATPADHPLAADGQSVSVAALADEHVLLLEDGHCLRDQALSVCRIVGAVEREGFRATSLETLRQMVAAGVAVTLLPMLAVRPPVSNPDGVALVPFTSPAPNRHISMFWRDTSPFHQLLPRLAEAFRRVPADVVTVQGPRPDGA